MPIRSSEIPPKPLRLVEQKQRPTNGKRSLCITPFALSATNRVG